MSADRRRVKRERCNALFSAHQSTADEEAEKRGIIAEAVLALARQEVPAGLQDQPLLEVAPDN